MQYSDDRHHLRVEIKPRECKLPSDELTRMQRLLEPVGEAVESFPQSELSVGLMHHDHSDLYHVECRLRLPGKTLFTSDWDPYLDSAFMRCVRKLVRKAQDYREHPDRQAAAVEQREDDLNNNVVVSEEADGGPLGKFAAAGDYRGFRIAASGYEDWLRKRVGRWIQRYPEAEARLGKDLSIGDLVEEVYLNAFERFGQRPTEVPISQWLDSLLEPSLQAMLHDPDEEHQAASFARTVRSMPAVQS
jgi:hypothetical protein